MKVSRRQLNSIIENYILSENFQLTTVQIENLFDQAVKTIINEVKNKTKFLPQKVIDKVVDALKKYPNIYIVPASDNVNKKLIGFEGYVLHVNFDKKGNMKGDSMQTEVVKDKDLQSSFQKNPFTTPIVVIVEANIKSKSSFKRFLLHELGHIKNNFIKYIMGVSLNVEEVRNLLRKDLKNMTAKEMVRKFKEEGRLGKGILPFGFEKLVEKLKSYYDGGFSEPPDELGVDEFAVRISAIQRDLVAQSSIAMSDSPANFNVTTSKYGVDIAGLSLFLKQDFDKSEIDAVVQNIEDETFKNV